MVLVEIEKKKTTRGQILPFGIYIDLQSSLEYILIYTIGHQAVPRLSANFQDVRRLN